jgi:hypothetical protein
LRCDLDYGAGAFRSLKGRKTLAWSASLRSQAILFSQAAGRGLSATASFFERSASCRLRHLSAAELSSSSIARFGTNSREPIRTVGKSPLAAAS